MAHVDSRRLKGLVRATTANGQSQRAVETPPDYRHCGLVAPALFPKRINTREKEVTLSRVQRGVCGGRECSVVQPAAPALGAWTLIGPTLARNEQACGSSPLLPHPDANLANLANLANFAALPTTSALAGNIGRPCSSSSASPPVLLLTLILPPPPPSFSSPLPWWPFPLTTDVELVVRAGLFSSPHFAPPGRPWESNPLPHPPTLRIYTN